MMLFVVCLAQKEEPVAQQLSSFGHLLGLVIERKERGMQTDPSLVLGMDCLLMILFFLSPSHLVWRQIFFRMCFQMSRGDQLSPDSGASQRDRETDGRSQEMAGSGTDTTHSASQTYGREWEEGKTGDRVL